MKWYFRRYSGLIWYILKLSFLLGRFFVSFFVLFLLVFFRFGLRISKCTQKVNVFVFVCEFIKLDGLEVKWLPILA